MERSEKILIVEDERLIALDLQRRLERYSFSVVGIASSAEEAVEKADDTLPDMILMDINLEGPKDGIDAARMIRERHRIPIVFVTAYSDEKTLERAKAVEPFGYILKPFKEKELLITIENGLYKHRMDVKLLEKEQWFQAILKSVGDGIIATDRDNRIRFMNAVAETLTGWRESEIQDRPLEEVFPIRRESALVPLSIPVPGTDAEENFPLFYDNIVLTNRFGTEIHIEGTASRITGHGDEVLGTALAFRDLTRIKRMSESLTYHQSHDTLTGLANREEFYQILSIRAGEARRERRTHSLIYLDLDQFKIVNDISGHAAGDELLRQISNELASEVPAEAAIARLGGDEFAVLLPDTPLDEARPAAERLLARLNQKFIWQNNLYSISASMSLVPIDHRTTDIYSVLAAADDACYLAKEEGGNRIKVYETTDYRFLKRRGEMEWISRLTRALEENMFCLYFQPIVPVDGSVQDRLKFEILLRLRNEDGSCTPPADFIPPAEKYNLMPAIDRWVIRETMRTYVEMSRRDRSAKDRLFCINISGASLVDHTLLEYILDQFDETSADPFAFCFEMTETTAIANLKLAHRFMKRLKLLGCTFSLDDFGSGFSSLAYLKNLPVDFLKIDGAFVKDLSKDPIGFAMVEAINNIGHVMGIKTIAEFVTDGMVKEKLMSIGVDFAQGYEIAKPRPLSEL